LSDHCVGVTAYTRVDSILATFAIRRFLTLLLAFPASTAHAWGRQGHHVIASLAHAQLTTKAKGEIDKLLPTPFRIAPCRSIPVSP